MEDFYSIISKFFSDHNWFNCQEEFGETWTHLKQVVQPGIQTVINGQVMPSKSITTDLTVKAVDFGEGDVSGRSFRLLLFSVLVLEGKQLNLKSQVAEAFYTDEGIGKLEAYLSKFL